MDIPFKIKFWWQVVLILGILFCASSIFFDISFLNKGNLFGLGIGCILIGIGYWKAKHIAHNYEWTGYLVWTVFKFDIISKVLILLGCVFLFLFLSILMFNLLNNCGINWDNIVRSCFDFIR